MVVKKGERIESIPLKETSGRLRVLPLNHPLIEKARGLDICLGKKE